MDELSLDRTGQGCFSCFLPLHYEVHLTESRYIRSWNQYIPAILAAALMTKAVSYFPASAQRLHDMLLTKVWKHPHAHFPPLRRLIELDSNAVIKRYDPLFRVDPQRFRLGSVCVFHLSSPRCLACPVCTLVMSGAFFFLQQNLWNVSAENDWLYGHFILFYFIRACHRFGLMSVYQWFYAILCRLLRHSHRTNRMYQDARGGTECLF